MKFCWRQSKVRRASWSVSEALFRMLKKTQSLASAGRSCRCGGTGHRGGLNRLILLALLLFCLTSQIDEAWALQLDLADPAVRAEFVEQLARRSLAEKEQAWAIAQSQGWAPKVEIDGVLFELMSIRNGRVYMNTTNNVNAAISTATDLVRNTAPYNVDGTGETAGIWDGGAVLSTHQEFGGRVSVMDGAASHYHSTHVGGTVGASGVVAAALGMAPNVDIDSYDWNNDEAEMVSRAMSFAGEAGTIQVSNHSYGTSSGWNWNYTPPRWYGTWGLGYREDELFGMYSDTTSEWDEICYNAPYYLPFKSAGNDRDDDAPSSGTTFAYYDGSWKTKSYDPATDPFDDGWDNGYDTIPHKGIAKNLMTVGAVNDAVLSGSRHLPNATMADFSGWGPTDDGRIKPDVVGNGVNLYSTDDDAIDDYQYLDGTSMSTPNISGSAILLLEYYKDLFPGQYMRASTIKALIIHTADDLGNPGPDYSFGWGLMDTQAAADVIGEQHDNPGQDIIVEGLLNPTNPDDNYTIDSDGSTPIRITICWTDPPGSATSTPDDSTIKLVNDLDLRIVGPGGSPTYYPYILDPSNRNANATTGDNIRDNVEQVYIDTPTVGTYTVQVSHKASLTNGQQHYSLILSGGGAIPGGVLVLIDECSGGLDYVSPALANLGITDVTLTTNAPDFESYLSAGNWYLVIVDTYLNGVPSSMMDELVNYYDAGGKVIFFGWDLYSRHATHPFVDRAGVTLTGDYLATEPIYSWIESPLFNTPNPVPDMTLYSDLCSRDGQYVQPDTASAHAGYTTAPTANQAAITINAESRLILNAFAPQNFDQDQDTDGKIDMIELYENEINFLTGCLPPVPTYPEPPDGATEVPLDTMLSWTTAVCTTGELYAIDSDLAQLFTLDKSDGSETLIGSTSSGPSIPAGLAFDGTNMYTIDLTDSNALYKLDLSNATPTLLGDTGVTGWQGLASDPTDGGQLYGITQSDQLYRIAPDGTTTLVAAVAVPDLIAALEFDGSGTLWGIDFYTGDVVTINKSTGALTIITTTIAGFQGLDFDCDGQMWAQNTNTDSLYTINLGNGIATLVGPNATQFVKGLSFDSLPGTPEGVSAAGEPIPAAGTSETGKTGRELIDATTTRPVQIDPNLVFKGTEKPLSNEPGGGSGSLDLDMGSEAPMPEPSPVVRVDVGAYNDRPVKIASGQIDATASEAFTPAQHQDLSPVKTLTTGGAVLWDLTHGVYFDYEPSGRYSSLVSVLTGKGYTIDTTTAGVDTLDLSAYDILVVCLASAWNSAYTASEVTAIQTFVNNGGGLLVMGDNTDCPNGNVNPVAQAYGSTCGVSDLLPYDFYFSDLAAHAIFTGCSQIYYRAAGELSASSPAQLVAWGDAGEGTVAVAEAGTGRIVVTGDTGFCTNDHIGEADSQLFAENVFDWLSEAGGCYSFGGSSQSYSFSNRLRGNLYTLSTGRVLSEIKMELNFSGGGTYTLTDEFDYGEDQTSHSYSTTGAISIGAYSCDTASLRIGSCSATGSARIVVSVIPGTDAIKLRYRVPWAGTVGGTLYVDGVSQGNLSQNGCTWQEMTVTGMSSYTADGSVEIKITDETTGCEGDTQITYLEVYSQESTADLYYYVLESTTVNGSYTPIFEKLVTTTSIGQAFYSSGPISVMLQPGKYYGIGVCWGSETVTFYRDSASLPRSWALGTVEGAVQHDITPPITSPITPNIFSGAEYSMVLCFAGVCPPTYDVYFGTAPGSLSLICADLPHPPYAPPGPLLPNTTYYWKVVAKNCCGQTSGPVWSFTTVSDCLKRTAPEYDDWLGGANLTPPAPWSKPDCWCYKHQCRGDADGKPLSPWVPNMYVSLVDLNILRAAINKSYIDIDWPANGICADFDHKPISPYVPTMRVSLADLNILRQYINVTDDPPGTIPPCDQPPIITGPYNFWTSP